MLFYDTVEGTKKALQSGLTTPSFEELGKSCELHLDVKNQVLPIAHLQHRQESFRCIIKLVYLHISMTHNGYL